VMTDEERLKAFRKDLVTARSKLDQTRGSISSVLEDLEGYGVKSVDEADAMIERLKNANLKLEASLTKKLESIQEKYNKVQ
jgi:DNA-binding transcriptional regulator YbjK